MRRPGHALLYSLSITFCIVLGVFVIDRKTQKDALLGRPANRQMLAACPSPCVTVSKDLGNYVITGTLHVTLSPEEANDILTDEEQTAATISSYAELMPKIRRVSTKLRRSQDHLDTDEDELTSLNQEREYLLQRLKGLQKESHKKGKVASDDEDD